ncbi:hypothetical protein DICA4_F25378 [Diutina catenulata]
MSQSIVYSYHEYESAESGSLQFLENLLSDPHSYLSNRDINSILGCLERRECNMPFSIDSSQACDNQGIVWTRDLRRKFQLDRWRVGRQSWFHNVDQSREHAIKNLTVHGVHSLVDYFTFDRYYPKLRLDITHFQLRNLVCCNSNACFYPSNDQESFSINRMMVDADNPARSGAVKLDCMVESNVLPKNANSRVSTLACNENLLVCGTMEGGYILLDISDANTPRVVGEYHLTSSFDGITNHIIIGDDDLWVSSNEKSLRNIDLRTNRVRHTANLDFAINCAATNPSEDVLFVTGDSVDPYLVDVRAGPAETVQTFKGHRDFGFSCDWSRTNDNLLLTGNQDTTVGLWDKRQGAQPLFSWSGALGESTGMNAGPVRNCIFSDHGDYVCWAESLDHVGIASIGDLQAGVIDRVQSIDFIGKCVGLNLTPCDNGRGESMTVGISDCQLGGVLQYKLESPHKVVDFDMMF